MNNFQPYFEIFLFLHLFVPTRGVGVEILGGQGRAGSGTWCYEDAACDQAATGSDWNKGVCSTGKRQSPIDIATSGLTVEYDTACPIDFGLTEASAYDITEYQIGHLEFTYQIYPKNTKAKFRHPAANDGTYTLAQIHFHWGTTSTEGSEHKIGGVAYGMEMHLVHYRSGGPNSYPSVTDAVESGKGDALAVIGFMLEVDDTNAPASGTLLEPLTKAGGAFSLVPTESDKPADRKDATADMAFKLHDLLMKQTMAYTYEGSLTTPDCNEIVQWIVLKEPVKVQAAQVEVFRTGIGKKSTFRKVQSIVTQKAKLVELVH